MVIDYLVVRVSYCGDKLVLLLHSLEICVKFRDILVCLLVFCILNLFALGRFDLHLLIDHSLLHLVSCLLSLFVLLSLEFMVPLQRLVPSLGHFLS